MRRAQQILSLVPWLLLILAIGFWVRDCDRIEEFGHLTRAGSGNDNRQDLLGFGSLGSHVFLGRVVTVGGPPESLESPGWRHVRAADTGSGWGPKSGFLGFQYWHVKPAPRPGVFKAFDARGFAIPYWFIIALLAIYPIIEVRRIRIARQRLWRRAMNQCPNCGYDLRSSPDRCPECGENRPDSSSVLRAPPLATALTSASTPSPRAGHE